jgi:hypothetical protein
VRFHELHLAVLVDFIEPQKLKFAAVLLRPSTLHLLLREDITIETLLPLSPATGLGLALSEQWKLADDAVVDASPAWLFAQFDVVILLEDRHRDWQGQGSTFRVPTEVAGQTRAPLLKLIGLHQ